MFINVYKCLVLWNLVVSLSCVSHGIRFKVNVEDGLSGDSPSLFYAFPQLREDLGYSLWLVLLGDALPCR